MLTKVRTSYVSHWLGSAIVLERVHVMGTYWCEDNNSPTPLGELIAAAKDHDSETAVTKLQEQLSHFARNLETPSGGTVSDTPSSTLVVPVPNGNGSNRRLVPALASAVADAMGAWEGVRGSDAG